MSPLRTVRLIMLREIRERGATRAYLFATLGTVVLVIGLIAVPTLLAGDGPQERTLGVVGDAPQDLEGQLATLLPDEVTVAVTEMPDRDAAVAALQDDAVDAVLVDRRELLADGRGDDELRRALDGVLQRDAVTSGLADLGVAPDDAAAVLEPPPPLQSVDIGDPDPGPDGFIVASGMAVLLFLSVQINAASVMSGALEEKSSRVVEVLVSVARPWQLLAGKLLGMSVLALTQMGLVVGAALATNAAVHAFEIPGATGTLVAVSLAMLLAGFLFYASMYAVAGSLASSVEDAQSTAGPLGLVLVAAYFAVFFVALPDPTSLASRILTFVPPTAPFFLPARLGLGALPVWQAVLSIMVTAVAAFATVRLAGRLYASSLLAGGKLTWRDAWRGEPIR